MLTGLLEINGQPPFAATSSIANAALAEAGFDIQDLLLKPSLVLPYVEAVDATNANGTTASLVQVTGRPDWIANACRLPINKYCRLFCPRCLQQFHHVRIGACAGQLQGRGAGAIFETQVGACVN